MSSNALRGARIKKLSVLCAIGNDKVLNSPDFGRYFSIKKVLGTDQANKLKDIKQRKIIRFIIKEFMFNNLFQKDLFAQTLNFSSVDLSN